MIMFEDVIAALLIILIVLLLFFFIARELLCWYWKINARLEAQRLTNAYLKEIRDLLLRNNAAAGALGKEVSDISHTQSGSSAVLQSANTEQNPYQDLPDL